MGSMQTSMLEFVRRGRSSVDSDISEAVDGPPMFVDLFCGIGGASQGAIDAGYRVCLAVDSCAEALSIHKLNHPGCAHMCLNLPARMALPLPTGGTVHIHGSPPCTDVSIMNQKRDQDGRTRGTDLITWFLKFAMDSGASSWTMEQVATPIVRATLEKLRSPKSLYRNRFSYTVVNLSKLGVPQFRKRLIAGPPDLIARLRRMNYRMRSVRDVVPTPLGTHVRHELETSATKRQRVDAQGNAYFGYKRYTDDDCCTPTSGPAWTVTARHGLQWANPGTGAKLIRMTPLEVALLQTFPPTYKLGARVGDARRGVGNALPPLAMQRILGKRAAPTARCVSPSLAWNGPLGRRPLREAEA